MTRGPADKCSAQLIVAAGPIVGRPVCVRKLSAFCPRTGSGGPRHGCLRGAACVSDCAYALRACPPLLANEQADMPRASRVYRA